MSSRHFLLLALSLLAVVSAVSASRKHGGALVGGYSPIKDVSDPYVQGVGQFAVTEYNKDQKAHLKFVKVVKGESQVVSGTNYRLFIEADDNSQYVAIVYDVPWRHQRSLTSFTPAA
ncbi:hypothetical protein SOVF_029630 [Spinacia oleracea]|uniref:Cysteine proteinase inhibitor 5 n=1 Tax=Spinacia oleracea TaxID=3562 RepID=A0A9R0I0M2_SPIOL|nr:cysteine proteinase inhibitor 5 [Spinacia oleracea]KNA22917.1 hypothetical protein SOVF_029630 [Spinacia oleracea]